MENCDRAWLDSKCEGELIQRTSAGGFTTSTCELHLYDLQETLAAVADRYPEINHPMYCACSGCEGAW